MEAHDTAGTTYEIFNDIDHAPLKSGNYGDSLVEIFKGPQFLLRGLQFILCILVFALAAASGDAISGKAFVIFVGVTGWLLTIFFLSTYLLHERISKAHGRYLPLGEIMISILYIIFFFAGSVVLALSANNQRNEPGKASSFFGFVTCGTLLGSIYYAFQVNTVPLPCIKSN